MDPMKYARTMTGLLLSCFCLVGFSGAAERKLQRQVKDFLGEPHLEMQQIFSGERFPNIVVTPRGTVLATWGTSGVRVRRSEDGGGRRRHRGISHYLQEHEGYPQGSGRRW